MKKYLSETIGTFALVFFGTGAIIVNQESGTSITHLGVAVCFGLVVAAMIYVFGDNSGAHLNPAVTIGFSLAKLFPKKEIIPYILSQTFGALLASLTLRFLFPENVALGATQPSGSDQQSFIFEVILSFFLMLTILQVSTGSKEKGLFAASAVGSVVLLEALFGGPISGASMNPIRSFAPALISGQMHSLWIYLSAPMIGSMLAVLIWKIIK